MCDRIAGELLVCFHRKDQAAYRVIDHIIDGAIPHVQVIENLADRLRRVGLEILPWLQFQFWRLRVPPGEEEWKINYLQFFYKHSVIRAIANREIEEEVLNQSNHHLQVVPHSFLHVSASALPSFGSINPTKMHGTYKQMIGWKSPGTAAGQKPVLILDTGINQSMTYNSAESRNFVDPARVQDVLDDNGHGTAVATIVQDLCPTVNLVIYKVADQSGRASEWDTLAALAATNHAKVVNMSLSFGLEDISCPLCGRESHSSRSAVFENLVMQIAKADDGAIIVGAAGNSKKMELSFPARYAHVVAIESVDSTMNMSVFTNCSTTDHEGNRHPNVFVLPGGQTDNNDQVTEYGLESSQGEKYYGTSFAAAYASGIITETWSQSAHLGKDGSQIIDLMRANADAGIPNYDPAIHGNGLMRLT